MAALKLWAIAVLVIVLIYLSDQSMKYVFQMEMGQLVVMITAIILIIISAR